VNAEQASKSVMQGPTRLRFGEAEDDGIVRANKFPSDLPGIGDGM
jgi:hypothetical protein